MLQRCAGYVRRSGYLLTLFVQPDHYAPFFETTIRYLGGTLSAYALSGEPVLARLADELGQLLIPAFDGTTSGLPAYSVNVET